MTVINIWFISLIDFKVCAPTDVIIFDVFTYHTRELYGCVLAISMLPMASTLREQASSCKVFQQTSIAPVNYFKHHKICMFCCTQGTRGFNINLVRGKITNDSH